MRIALALLALVATVGCNGLAVNTPTIEAIRPRIVGLDFEAVDLEFDVDVRNPYSIPIKTPRFRYGMDVEGSNLFEGQEHPSGIDLPADGLGTATLPVRLTYMEVVKVFQSLMNTNEAGYRLHGAFLLEAMGKTHELPMEKEGRFPVLKVPRFTVGEVEKDASLTEVRLSIDAEVENPNVFPVGIGDLGYGIDFGTIRAANLTARTEGQIPAEGKGTVRLEGKVSGLDAVRQLLGGGELGDARLLPTGSIATPYGDVRLPDPGASP